MRYRLILFRNIIQDSFLKTGDLSVAPGIACPDAAFYFGNSSTPHELSSAKILHLLHVGEFGTRGEG